MEKQKIKNIITEYLILKREIEFAYIFGSFVYNDLYRDINIAVYLQKGIDYNNTTKFRYNYESGILGDLGFLLHSDKTGFVLLNKADLLLFLQVINSGILLFEKDRFERIKIEDQIRNDYIDTEHLTKIKYYYFKKSVGIENV